MKETFIKKYWDEGEITFYLHFVDEDAVRQIEVSSEGAVLTSEAMPVNGDFMLYDKALSDLELDINDFISKEEFTKAWDEFA